MKVIGVGGYARCGKDTFVGIAKQILSKNNYRPMRVAFADTLKDEVQSMFNSNNFDLDIYTTNTSLKSKLRPLLVWWGCARRDLSEGGLYWVNVVDKQLREIEADYIRNGESTDQIVALISDVRFPNEAQWLHEKWNGQLIHLRRWTSKQVRDGYGDDVFAKVFDDAPNEEEAKNDPLIREVADVKVEWESKNILPGADATQDAYLRKQVQDALNSTKYFKHSSIGTLIDN